MFSATVYVEREGKIEKLSATFKTKSERDLYLIDKLTNENFSYFIANGDPVSVNAS